MNLRDLVYVLAVAEHQNFTHASKAVNVSQPALSNQIKKLETELGVDIFERGKNEVRLTEFGSRLAATARQINGLVDQIKHTALEYREVEAMPLRLGMTPTLAAYLSRYFLSMIAEIYPKMRLIIIEEKPVELAEMVETQALDIALIARSSHSRICGVKTRKPLNFTPLWLEPLYLGVGAGNPLADKASISAKDVPPEVLIRFDIPFGYDLEKDLPEPNANVAETIGLDARTASFETACRHVAHSNACTIINGIAAMQFKKDNLDLSFIPFQDAGNLREVGAISQQEYSRASVIDEIQNYIRINPPSGTTGFSSKASDWERASSLCIQ